MTFIDCGTPKKPQTGIGSILPLVAFRIPFTGENIPLTKINKK